MRDLRAAALEMCPPQNIGHPSRKDPVCFFVVYTSSLTPTNRIAGGHYLRRRDTLGEGGTLLHIGTIRWGNFGLVYYH